MCGACHIGMTETEEITLKKEGGKLCQLQKEILPLA